MTRRRLSLSLSFSRESRRFVSANKDGWTTHLHCIIGESDYETADCAARRGVSRASARSWRDGTLSVYPGYINRYVINWRNRKNSEKEISEYDRATRNAPIPSFSNERTGSREDRTSLSVATRDFE